MNASIDGVCLAPLRVPESPNHPKQSRRLLKLLLEAERALPTDPDAAFAYLNHAITLLAENEPGEVPERKARGGLMRWQISRVDRFIREHLDQTIRTSELASLLGFSVGHFSHAFKQTTGRTPMTYVTAVRVEAARDHMLRSTQSLSEIAISHGFCDQSHFCRLFKRETGTSPKMWKKLHTSSVQQTNWSAS